MRQFFIEGRAFRYSGSAGRIENCQVGVFLILSGGRDRCLIGRDLYPLKKGVTMRISAKCSYFGGNHILN